MKTPSHGRSGRSLRYSVYLSLVPCLVAVSVAVADELPPRIVSAAEGIAEAEHSGAGARTLRLAEAIDLALAENLDLALVRADEGIQEARVRTERRGLYPSLKFGAGLRSVDGTVQGSYGDFRDVNFDGHYLSTGLDYTLNIGAQLQAAAAARHDLDAAVLQTLASEQRLILRVVELFENLALAGVGVDIATSQMDDSREFLKIARIRAEGGVGLGADAARAEVALATSEARLVEAKGYFRETGTRLAVVLRIDPSVELVAAADEFIPHSLLPSADSWDPVSAARNRPDVEAVQVAAEAAASRLRARKWELLGPLISASAEFRGVGGHGEQASPDALSTTSSALGSAGRSISAWQNVLGGGGVPALSGAVGSAGRSLSAWRGLTDSPAQSVGLEGRAEFNLSVGWSFSLAGKSRITEERLKLRRVELEVERAQEAAVGEVHLAEQDMDTAMSLSAVAQRELDASLKNHRIHVARFKAGTALAIEVLDAQDAIARARLNQARSIADFNIAQTRLLAAAGALERGRFNQ